MCFHISTLNSSFFLSLLALGFFSLFVSIDSSFLLCSSLPILSLRWIRLDILASFNSDRVTYEAALSYQLIQSTDWLSYWFEVDHVNDWFIFQLLLLVDRLIDWFFIVERMLIGFQMKSLTFESRSLGRASSSIDFHSSRPFKFDNWSIIYYFITRTFVSHSSRFDVFWRDLNLNFKLTHSREKKEAAYSFAYLNQSNNYIANQVF